MSEGSKSKSEYAASQGCLTGKFLNNYSLNHLKGLLLVNDCLDGRGQVKIN